MKEIIVLQLDSQRAKLLEVNVFGEIDLKEAIRKASIEYCISESRGGLVQREKGFSYKDFFDVVPNYICKNYGFEKVKELSLGGIAEYFGQVIAPEEMKELETGSAKHENVEQQICDTAMHFIRMWGTTEALNDNIPNFSPKEISDIANEWAKEFQEKKGQELVKFFYEKVDEVSRKKVFERENKK